MPLASRVRRSPSLTAFQRRQARLRALGPGLLILDDRQESHGQEVVAGAVDLAVVVGDDIRQRQGDVICDQPGLARLSWLPLRRLVTGDSARLSAGLSS